MQKMNRLLIATAIGALMACGGSPTTPTYASIGGSYELTITASSSCSANLPSETRVLKYVANVSSGPTFQVVLAGNVLWNSFAVHGTVSGPKVTFADFSFSEATTGGGIAFNGTGTVDVAADGSITGTVGGKYQTPSGAACIAGNHQIQMVKK